MTRRTRSNRLVGRLSVAALAATLALPVLQASAHSTRCCLARGIIAVHSRVTGSELQRNSEIVRLLLPLLQGWTLVLRVTTCTT